jgi:predicted DNA-binding transcriptional regulator AlpA
MELKLDISTYPPFIGLQDIMEMYGITRPTVIKRIQDGDLPPFQTSVGSCKPGWTREYFVFWMAEKAKRDIDQAGELELCRTAG